MITNIIDVKEKARLWQNIKVDLSAFEGKTIKIRLYQRVLIPCVPVACPPRTLVEHGKERGDERLFVRRPGDYAIRPLQYLRRQLAFDEVRLHRVLRQRCDRRP